MSKSAAADNGLAPNAYRLLWGGFMAILAAGVGFAIRGGFLDNWRGEFSFTDAEIGGITGAGGPGFCFGIIIGGIICDKVGYGKLVVAAFLLHIISAVVTFLPVPTMEKQVAYQLLYWGSFLFAFANGTLEAVANPLVATLFFRNRTHYLNILHASWPAGLVLGSASGWVLDDLMPAQFNLSIHWKYQFALFLIPTVLYGLMFFAQHFPKSEASQKGLSLGEMFKDVGILGGLVVCFLVALFFSDLLKPVFTLKDGSAEQASQAAQVASYVGYAIGGFLWLWIALLTRFSIGSPLLFVLFIAHALVGAVELGTDTWIQNITGNLLTSEQGKWLFVFTSLMMFALRFCADFIEKKIGLSPVGILLVCAILACLGLILTSWVETFLFALVALSVYGVGKTFFWPTMLAVASDRFPRTGAVAISMMGGIGMMSFGLLGSPGLGYFKDRYAGEDLQRTNPTAFQEYKAGQPSKFLPFIFPEAVGLDGKKLEEVKSKVEVARKELAAAGNTDPNAPLAKLTEAERAVRAAGIAGDRKTLVTDAVIPAALAVIYLGLMLYFASIGGYKPVHIDGSGTELGTAES
ncbi:MAG: MFS transporter [Planctomycetaceae bacterium]|nr:MFS transporter [Planctomycetaceae bacterium]